MQKAAPRSAQLREKGHKGLDLQGRESYSPASLQLRITSYQAPMAKYNPMNRANLNSCADRLPAEPREQVRAVTAEGQLLARASPQAPLNIADTATGRSLHGRYETGLVAPVRQISGRAPADLPFRGSPLFAASTAESLRTSKVSRAT